MWEKQEQSQLLIVTQKAVTTYLNSMSVENCGVCCDPPLQEKFAGMSVALPAWLVPARATQC